MDCSKGSNHLLTAADNFLVDNATLLGCHIRSFAKEWTTTDLIGQTLVTVDLTEELSPPSYIAEQYRQSKQDLLEDAPSLWTLDQNVLSASTNTSSFHQAPHPEEEEALSFVRSVPRVVSENCPPASCSICLLNLTENIVGISPKRKIMIPIYVLNRLIQMPCCHAVVHSYCAHQIGIRRNLRKLCQNCFSSFSEPFIEALSQLNAEIRVVNIE